ncbi:MAG: hypothetical protein HY072_04295 [Deltaproteobacteria bacterium]|nr:hypothetical protein [Deltaproteobacteria bacterium]
MTSSQMTSGQMASESFKQIKIAIDASSCFNADLCMKILLNFKELINFDTDLSRSQYLSFYTHITHTDLVIVMDDFKKKFFNFFNLHFSELLCLESKIPVIVSQPNIRLNQKISNIMYLTFFPGSPNFSQEYDEFKNILKIAKKLNAKLTIFYKFIKKTKNYFFSAEIISGTGIPFYDPGLMMERNSHLKTISQWFKIAKQEGVLVDIKIGKDDPNSLEDEILQTQIEGNYDLISFDPKDIKYLKLSSLSSSCPIYVARFPFQSSCYDALENIKDYITHAKYAAHSTSTNGSV